MMVGSNLKDSQLQQIVDKVIFSFIFIQYSIFDFRQLSMPIKMAMEKLALTNFVP